MTSQILLTTGDNITAVIDKPWIVSQGMVNGALEKMGFTAITWAEGPGDYQTLKGSYQGPTTSYDKPSQIVSYEIAHAVSNVPRVPGVTPAVPTALPPATPKDAMVKAAKEVLSGPGIGYAILLDMGFIFLVKHFWNSRKKVSDGRRHHT
jgi:hypothetical protein